MTHTPGPWSLIGSHRGAPKVLHANGMVASVNTRCAAYNANARLIAAAPDYHDRAHALAMYVLQSPLYAVDLDVKAAVDDVLAIHSRVERS